MRGWHELIREDRNTKARKAARQQKWSRAEKRRGAKSPHELDEEESRLIFEARRLARELGLDVAGIGDRWSRSEAVELQHDGQLSAFRIIDGEAVQ
ncbi:hypothetical protein [Thalassovita sp.]|uniref:hypothetical protein n=1 Tax=Thalassovita sp. TaxID=1979401 RepID=UPI002B275020|nr:hypothetical protein [Thalassovita sp.]